MAAEPANDRRVAPFSEKGFYLSELRDRTIAIAVPGDLLCDAAGLEPVLKDLEANRTRVILISDGAEALGSLAGSEPLAAGEPTTLAGRVWRRLGQNLRVGIATLKGLAFASDAPVLAVSTLAALACAAGPTDRLVVPLLDARRGELYAAGYSARAGWETVVPEGVYTPEALAARLTTPCVLVGEGVALCGDAIAARLGGDVERLPPPEGNARARYVGALGVEQLERGAWVSAAQVAPHYLRRAEAEVKRTGQRFEPAPRPPKTI